MTRQIIQIATVPESANMYANLYAVANDGTLWGLCLQDEDSTWRQLDPLPQPEQTP